MKFWKYQGIGNDFVLLENFDGRANKDPSWVTSVCNRRFGIGADGILYIERSEKADAEMSILNSDGSVAEMCGNGIRCVAKHLYDFGIVKRKHMTIDTLAGTKIIECTVIGNQVTDVKVGMGAAILDCANIPMKCPGKFIDSVLEVEGSKIRGTAVSMGNPHFITFQNFTDEEMERLAPLIQSDDVFPKKTNVEFVKSSNGVSDGQSARKGCRLDHGLRNGRLRDRGRRRPSGTGPLRAGDRGQAARRQPLDRGRQGPWLGDHERPCRSECSRENTE